RAARQAEGDRQGADVERAGGARRWRAVVAGRILRTTADGRVARRAGHVVLRAAPAAVRSRTGSTRRSTRLAERAGLDAGDGRSVRRGPVEQVAGQVEVRGERYI